QYRRPEARSATEPARRAPAYRSVRCCPSSCLSPADRLAEERDKFLPPHGASGTGVDEKCVRPLPFTPCKTFLGFARGSFDLARRYARGCVTVTVRARAPGRPCP